MDAVPRTIFAINFPVSRLTFGTPLNMHPIATKLIVAGALVLPVLPASGDALVAAFNSPASVAVRAPAYTATGSTVEFSLGFAVPTGTDLTVIDNTGSGFIQGSFGNLAQGQEVRLNHDGISYPFVANYHGGTGNDLVLQWASTRLLAWGSGSQGKLGNNSTLASPEPAPVDTLGVLAGKTVTSVASGDDHNLALCADGTLAAWGNNGFLALGVEGISHSRVPVEVARTGVLAGKAIISISACSQTSIALCADGTLVGWGSNLAGILGNDNISPAMPTVINRTGALAGKTVVAISLGNEHALVLCSDGTLATWGSNGQGQLGNGSPASSLVPVAVNRTGVLTGKTVVAISSIGLHNLALCSDGTLVSWGANFNGQLGNNSKTLSRVPIQVSQTGVLVRKRVVAISAGATRSLALTADGTLAAWGASAAGQLGNGSTVDSLVPVLVDRSGALAGKSVTAIASGSYHSLAWCSDGTLVTWGSNSAGELGYETTGGFGAVPRRVEPEELGAGERFAPRTLTAGEDHSVAVVASPPDPLLVSTAAATDISATDATLKGAADPNGTGIAMSFEYGLTTAYGATVAATPAALTGTGIRAVSAALAGLRGNTTYHYRAVAKCPGKEIKGADMAFVTGPFATLAGLVVGGGTLSPAFDPLSTSYALSVANAIERVTIVPVTAGSADIVAIHGTAVASGSSSPPIDLAVGDNRITVSVTSASGVENGTYTITVTRLPKVFRFHAAGDTAVTVPNLTAAGGRAEFELNFAPPPGTHLRVIDNAGLEPIGGTFDNLPQGRSVSLNHEGIRYRFVADYFGGNGNDLVLRWADLRLTDWGGGPVTGFPVPTPLANAGALSGKTITRAAAGRFFSVVLCSDGTVATWGDNSSGQLGKGNTVSGNVPALVNQTGALADKLVVNVAAGASHVLALCSDGTVAAWGSNGSGQLGTSGFSRSLVPVMVNRSGPLAGKKVIAIAAGAGHSLALCSDGSVASWGGTALGSSSKDSSPVPVAVDTTGVLAGKSVLAIAAGGSHSLALCSDGSLAAWGANGNGQLGTKTTLNSKIPALVDSSGILSGKKVSTIAAGSVHSLALCKDGTVAGWGFNDDGRLGTNSAFSSTVPAGVHQTGVLAAKTVTAIRAGSDHSLALCSDGTLAAWGENSRRQLGNNSSSDSSVPVLVHTVALQPGDRFSDAVSDPGSYHNMATVASPAPPLHLDVLVQPTLNRQTGLYEQTIRITNTGEREIAAFDFSITGLPTGVEVYNASACEDGVWCVQHRQPLAAGASVTMILEYYAPVRGTVIEPDIAIHLVAGSASQPVAAGPGFAVDRCELLDDGLLIEFTATPGWFYEVQYSENSMTWKVSPVRIRAAGNRVQWIDRGPPRTDSPPAGKSSRFYRVRELPR